MPIKITHQFVLGLVVVDDLELLQVEVKMTFIHNDLAEEIYREKLKGFVSF